MTLEFERNRERYELLRWAQQSFDNFRVVPPGTGIVHQVNLEYLAKVVQTREVDGKQIYTLVTFDDETYPNLSTLGDPEMLAISAVLVLERSYAQKNPQAVSALSMLMLMGAKDIETVAYGEATPFEE